jgi:hypothetical protein
MDKRLAGLTALIASGVSFAVTSLTPQIVSIWQHTDDLTDSERDYVLRVIELQSKATPTQAQAIASLTNSATGSYLRDRTFRTKFADAVTNYALTVSSAAAVDKVQQENRSGQAPSSAGASAALGRVQAASAITDASLPGTTTETTQAALRSARGRVFFQVARADDRGVAQNVNAQLTSIGSLNLSPIEGVEVVSSFSGRTQLRYFFHNDRDSAQRIASALAGALPGLTCSYVAGYEVSGRVKPQLFEVWLAPGARPEGRVGQGGTAVTC